MESERELPKYVITEGTPTLVNVTRSEVHMVIAFKRRLTSEAMMTFFPSFLLISFSYATSFFRLPNFFNTAIATNLTVMLTMTNLMSSVLTRLAQTSYIKWIEYWLIFAQLVPFVQVINPIICMKQISTEQVHECFTLQVILITAIEGLRVQDQADEGTRIDMVWLPPESNSSEVRIMISEIYHFKAYLHNHKCILNLKCSL